VLFELEQVLAAYDFQLQQIEKCEQQLEKYMKAQPTRPVVGPVLAQAAPGTEQAPPNDKKKARHRKPPNPKSSRF
jgi:hypothetical protein